MKSGSLDRTIEFWKPGAETDNGFGAVTGAPELQFTRKAKKVEARTREIFANAGTDVQLPAIFEIRSDSETRTIDETWTLVFEGQRFNIRSISEIGRREGLRIEAVTGSAQ